MLEFYSSRNDFKTAALVSPAMNARQTVCCYAADNASTKPASRLRHHNTLRSLRFLKRQQEPQSSCISGTIYRFTQTTVTSCSNHDQIAVAAKTECRIFCSSSHDCMTSQTSPNRYSSYSRLSQHSPRLKGILSCATVSHHLRSASSACPF